MRKVGVFLSYAHEDRAVTLQLKALLESEGFEVWVDEGELRAGDSLIWTIATAIHEMEFVVALISDASAGSRWCSYEIHLAMTSGLNREGVKLLPVRVGSAPIPVSLEDTYCLPLDPADIDAGVAKPAADIRSHHEDRVASAEAGEPLPTTGSDRVAVAKQARTVARAADDDLEFLLPEAVRIIGIVKEGVGQPRNNGTPGSALYRVPLRLSQRPSALWGQLFVECWKPSASVHDHASSRDRLGRGRHHRPGRNDVGRVGEGACQDVEALRGADERLRGRATQEAMGPGHA